MESFATPYPVVFYDGEQEHDKGVVGVHSVLSFKRFQALMSQKTGVPANQLSAVFVCRRTLKDTDKRQKLPINGNTNFNIILNQHNPSREKDCHFLVSIKKSKKERKGIRKRNAEAENADDEDSNSSRGDVSPSDERPKLGRGTDDPFSPHSTSPPMYRQRSSLPTTPSPNANGQRISSNSPNGNATMITLEEKVERTLLKREGMGQNGFASPCAGWQNGGMLSQRVEGFSLPPIGKGESLQCPHIQNVEERLQMENKAAWKLQKDVADTNRQSERMNSHGAAQQPQHLLQGPLVDLFVQERFNDSLPQSPSVRPGSSGMARNSSVQANTTLTSRSSVFSSTPMSRASHSPSRRAIGNFLPRMVTGQSNQLLLQQAQAHMSQLQQHQQPIAMSHLEFSKLSGVFRSLVGRESRVETQKICKLCSFWQERNIAEPPFHWCVNDTITMGFKGASPAGPIGRPSRRPVKAGT